MQANFSKSIIRNSLIKSIIFCIAFTLLFMILSFFKNFIPLNYERWAHGIIGTIAAFLTTAIFLRFDKNPFTNIGLRLERFTLTRFFAGMIIGITIMGVLVIAVLYFENVGIEVNKKSNFFNFLLSTFPLLPLAFMEELGFRAYPLEILKGKVGIRLAIIITSILFAIYHIANGWPISVSFYGPAVWGLVYGLAAVYSRGIAMPTGIHYAANLTTSALGDHENRMSIWTILPLNTPTSNSQEIDWANILPSLFLLVFAIVLMELYIRQNRPAG